MKRAESLKQSLTEDKNVEVTVKNALAADKKFLKRQKRTIQDLVEDLEDKLALRMSSTEPLDKATVEVTFQQILEQKELLDTYSKFEEKYIN